MALEITYILAVISKLSTELDAASTTGTRCFKDIANLLKTESTNLNNLFLITKASFYLVQYNISVSYALSFLCSAFKYDCISKFETSKYLIF